ncbi:ABC transporter ATP-binding protein [uncultured Methanolobus sp.]|uniref:ABC transporter ATP-binding protein n=1 Tax=uncultured Methanolobus sp. TaxID=218300 RepID=UPI0029C88810|nr:ABC transporter ATP-binding protein [uncultured Methanolobus sp.]
MMEGQNTPLLSIRDLTVTFNTINGPFCAIDQLDFDIYENETVAIVGESGCGKSVLGHASMRLLDGIADVKGSVKLNGEELYTMDSDAVRKIRGPGISLIPQSPSSSFNPVMKIGDQIKEMIENAGVAYGKDAKKRSLEYLLKVGFDDPYAIYSSYPHRLSGGMNERALIAMAISVESELVIADEPTKGLDHLSRKNVLNVLHEVVEDASMIMITHDIKAASTCEKVAVMYSGQIVEEGKVEGVLENPVHPYTKALLDAQPSRGMKPIKGKHTLEDHMAQGCRFMNRCDLATESCRNAPALDVIDKHRRVRCHYA